MIDDISKAAEECDYIDAKVPTGNGDIVRYHMTIVQCKWLPNGNLIMELKPEQEEEQN